MSQFPRRTIDDLKIRHELEPTLEDLYVEGEFDKEIIDNVFSKKGITSRIIYEIDTVDVPLDILSSYNLTEGNKQRVIALARELSSIEKSCHYSCLVDKDLDEWLSCIEEMPRLFWTKYTSIELYFFNEDFLKEIILVAAKCKIRNWGKFYESFYSCLKILFSLRLADKDMKFNLSWVDQKKSLNFVDECVIFDSYGYINKVLNSNAKTRNINEFKTNQEAWLQKLNGNPKLHIRGHDLIFLLAWVVGKANGVKEYSSENSISRLFVLLSHHAAEVLESI